MRASGRAASAMAASETTARLRRDKYDGAL
jgi:hypothetical protein